MKRKILKTDIIQMILDLDTRTTKLTETQLDSIIDSGFAELCTLVLPFTEEEIYPLEQHYIDGELKITLDADKDVVEVYDYHLTIENKTDFDTYKHGILKIREENCIYEDNRSIGRIHVDLEQVPDNQIADNVVMKYYYVPDANFDVIYLSQNALLALKNAMALALYSPITPLRDPEKESRVRAAMTRTARSVALNEGSPEDLTPTNNNYVFGGLYDGYFR
jgi:hypothetical protein